MIRLFIISILLAPAPVLAAPKDFAELVGVLLDIINLAVPLVFALTLLVFLWGITRAWIWGGGDEASVTKGKQIALAGIIGMVVMLGIWGIVALIKNSVFF